jgi:transcriptional regulator with XRE-family HTH domain
MSTSPHPATSEAEPVTELGRLLRDEGRRQTWLAERTGLDPAEISKYVKGHNIPGKDRALAIARVLHRTPGELGWPFHDDAEVAA